MYIRDVFTCQVHEGLRKWVAENVSATVADKVSPEQYYV